MQEKHGTLAALKARVVFVKRSARATKGGPRYSFSALVVAGNCCGRVGIGFGKSGEVAAAIRKAEELAVSQMVEVSLKARTIPHEVYGTYCGARVLLRPASPGMGIIASNPVRTVLECAGVKDATSKSLGAHNPANVARATLRALLTLRLSDRQLLKANKPKGPIVLKFPELDPGKNPPYSN